MLHKNFLKIKYVSLLAVKTLTFVQTCKIEKNVHTVFILYYHLVISLVLVSVEDYHSLQ